MNKPFVIEARGTKSASPICLLSPTIAAAEHKRSDDKKAPNTDSKVGFNLSSELVLEP